MKQLVEELNKINFKKEIEKTSKQAIYCKIETDENKILKECISCMLREYLKTGFLETCKDLNDKQAEKLKSLIVENAIECLSEKLLKIYDFDLGKVELSDEAKIKAILARALSEMI